jgi:IS5 family transposase
VEAAEESAMSVKRTGQLSFAEAMVSEGLGRNARLESLSQKVKWRRFERLLAGLRDPGPGRPGYLPLLMFKALLLQAWYGLSDAELEEALGDRLSFRRFVGLSLQDSVPDHSTFCRFRNNLVAAKLIEKLFTEFDRQLEQAGLILKRGTMLDATLIEAAAARPRGDGDAPRRDPDAAFTKKNGKTHYGYKAHVGTDQGSGFIRALAATPANVNDTTPADQLIRGDEKAVYADKAYDTHARRAGLKKRGIKPRIMRRPNKHHPILSPRWRRFNALVGKTRAAVETTFATWKRRMGLVRARYLGIAKNHAHFLMVALAFNMRKLTMVTP